MSSNVIVVRESYLDRLEDWDNLPEDVLNLPDEVKDDLDLLASQQIAPWTYSPAPEGPGTKEALYESYEATSVFLGYRPIPSYVEIGNHFGRDDDGSAYFYARHPSGVEVCFIQDVTNSYCKARMNCAENNLSEWIDAIVPKNHRLIKGTNQYLTRDTIKPWAPTARTPISVERQQSRIDKYLRSWCLDEQRSILLYGDYNTSKTTFAAAFITDTITHRAAYTLREDFHPCVWYITLQEWLDANWAWKTRDFEDRSVQRPHATPEEVESTSKRMGFRPVLWIEEFDKGSITAKSKDLVHTLINRVYSMDGCIVTTSNSSLKDLYAKFGMGIMGRLDGSRDGEEHFACLNFSAPKAAKAAKALSRIENESAVAA